MAKVDSPNIVAIIRRTLEIFFRLFFDNLLQLSLKRFL